MQSVTHPMQSTGSPAALYLALELGARKWVVHYGTEIGGARRRRTHAVRDGAAMVGALAADIVAAKRALGLPADALARSCYEAGRDGFWVHRLLTRLGVVNVVVDSSSIEVNRRARQAKTDRLDASTLLRMLWRYWHGEADLWHVVRVPTPGEEDARHATRDREVMMRERTRWRNRIHAALALHGTRVAIRRDFLERLEAARDWQGEPLPAGVVARVRRAWAQLQSIEAALRELRRQLRTTRVAVPAAAAERWAHRVAGVRGIGLESALTLGHEVFGRGLRNRREVGALTGMVSVPRASGDTRRDGGLSRSGNRRVRALAVELAWAWVKWQPASALSAWYARRWGGGGPRLRKIGIVALARKLLIALWRYGDGGALPVGAVLRPA